MATSKHDPMWTFGHGGTPTRPSEPPPEDPAISEARLLLRRREAEFFAANAALERCPDFLHDERQSLIVDVSDARERYFEAEEALESLGLPSLERAERAVLRADRARQQANAVLRSWRPSPGSATSGEHQKLLDAVRNAQAQFNLRCQELCALKNSVK